MNVDKKESPYEANISLYDAFKGTFKSNNNKYQVSRMISAHTILLALEGIPEFIVIVFLVQKMIMI